LAGATRGIRTASGARDAHCDGKRCDRERIGFGRVDIPRVDGELGIIGDKGICKKEGRRKEEGRRESNCVDWWLLFT
jgi:hypothetical protein